MITQDTINHVQQVQHEIMQQIAAICRRHNLSYFAIGGTALGAVRHQGFIPWDDDIDIGMPRRDYEAFLKYAALELPDIYYIQHFSTEAASPFYFTKIRKANTRFVEYYLKDAAIRQGIFVDIFPFDNVPDGKVLRRLHFRFCRFVYQLFLCKSLTTVCSSRFRQKDRLKSAVRRGVHFLLLPVPKVWLFRLLDHCVRMFNHKETREISHIVRRRLRVALEDLYPIRYLPFGNYEMPIPNNYDAYLRAQFGDYEALPPEAKRYGHIPYLVEFESQEESP